MDELLQALNESFQILNDLVKTVEQMPLSHLERLVQVIEHAETFEEIVPEYLRLKQEIQEQEE